jgi:hypothetical protein
MQEPSPFLPCGISARMTIIDEQWRFQSLTFSTPAETDIHALDELKSRKDDLTAEETEILRACVKEL